MISIRQLQRSDIPQVAKLRLRCFSYTRNVELPALENYLEELFFANPWYDEQLPSLVAVTSGGTVKGVAGVVPRPFMYRDEPVRAAVFTQFMVDEECRGKGVGRMLVQEFLRGPQDLSITDVANDACRRVWEHCGGVPAWPYSLQWTRAVRLRARLGEVVGQESRFLRYVAAPCFHMLDIAARQLRGSRGDVDGTEITEITLPGIAEIIVPLLRGFDLAPRYTFKDLAWLAVKMDPADYSRMYCCEVTDGAGALVGSYAYLLGGSGYSEVLYIVAEPGGEQVTVSSLIHHAQMMGAVAFRGQVQPWVAAALTGQGCSFRRSGPWTLVHSAHTELLQSILAGRACLSRLDGEWWMSC